MPPLSRSMSGLILPHDHFGSHLNPNGKTIDTDLEKKNFGYAGNVHASLWSELVIDNHPVVAEYIDPDCSALKENCLLTKNEHWLS